MRDAKSSFSNNRQELAATRPRGRGDNHIGVEVDLWSTALFSALTNARRYRQMLIRCGLTFFIGPVLAHNIHTVLSTSIPSNLR